MKGSEAPGLEGEEVRPKDLCGLPSDPIKNPFMVFQNRMKGAPGLPCCSHRAQHSLPGLLVKLFKFYLLKLTCVGPQGALFRVLGAATPWGLEDFLTHNFLSSLLFSFLKIFLLVHLSFNLSPTFKDN